MTPAAGADATGRSAATLRQLADDIVRWGRELGFRSIGIADTDLAAEEVRLLNWLAANRHGAMDYMARHGTRRSRPGDLVPGTVRVLTVTLDYWPAHARPAPDVLGDPTRAYVSRYALGRDYHKVLRTALQSLADRISGAIGPFGYRVFTDSAPVMEVALGVKAGTGWRGKHTLLLEREGSLFFVGELYTDLPLPVTPSVEAHCGTCEACLAACPTGAIVAPYQLDARRCISYLTIELDGPIPEELRPALGNRIYGCDDCQLACPWNRFASAAAHPDFVQVRNGLDDVALVDLFAWTRADFEQRMRGSAIRRIGYDRWSRNIAVALGNAPLSPAITAALEARLGDPSALVREHVAWALARQRAKRAGSNTPTPGASA